MSSFFCWLTLRISSVARRYVADSGNHRIVCYTFVDGDGEDDEPGFHFVRTMGSMGFGDGQLSSPFGVAVAPTVGGVPGNVFVADTLNSRICVFTRTGSFVRAFGRSLPGSFGGGGGSARCGIGRGVCDADDSSGSGGGNVGGAEQLRNRAPPGCFQCPRSVCIVRSRIVVVEDSRLTVMTLEGDIKQVLEFGCGPNGLIALPSLPLWNPASTAADASTGIGGECGNHGSSSGCNEGSNSSGGGGSSSALSSAVDAMRDRPTKMLLGTPVPVPDTSKSGPAPRRVTRGTVAQMKQETTELQQTLAELQQKLESNREQLERQITQLNALEQSRVPADVRVSESNTLSQAQGYVHDEADRAEAGLFGVTANASRLYLTDARRHRIHSFALRGSPRATLE